jgi:glycosyltransferase involved in cell wall biosynthesis
MLTAAAQDANIIVSGMVADVRPYLASASVQVVPLISGGGTRLKILEALAAGCPVVSTHKGAEGLSLSAPFPLILADRDEDIVAAIAELWDNPILAENLARLGYEWAKTYYDWSAIDPAITAAIAELSISVVSE